MVNVIKHEGLTIISKRIMCESVSVMVMFGVGSNQETDKNSGISHFLEHIMFETKNRTSIQVASEIENVGGIINAYTTNNRTAYFGKVPKKYFKNLVEILSDIAKNPKFDSKCIKREKRIVLDETKMNYDNPKSYQHLLMGKTLFKKHPMKRQTLGDIKAIRKITRKDLINYYKRYYNINNMVVSVVGDFKSLDCIKDNFCNLNKRRIKIRLHKEPLQKTNRILVKKKKILHSYVGMGFLGPDRLSKDSYAFDIIENILGYGMSSKLFIEIREKRGLAYYVGAVYESGKDFGYLMIHLSTDKKNIDLVKGLILTEIEKLKDISSKDLSDAKRSIEGRFLLDNEDVARMADTLSKAYLLKDVKFVRDYVKNVKSVSKKDVKMVIMKYINHYSLVVLKQE